MIHNKRICDNGGSQLTWKRGIHSASGVNLDNSYLPLHTHYTVQPRHIHSAFTYTLYSTT